MVTKFALIAAAAFLFADATLAQVPANAPAGSTGLCKDGSYWTGPTKQGACRGHKGVQTWYAATTPNASPAATNPAPSMAAAPAATTTAPTGATGLCKDGSYWTGSTKQGACRGHKGVQTWYAATTTAAPATTTAAPAQPPAAAAPTRAAAPARTTTPSVAGGGSGQVWVNTPSKVYHCPGDRWYGKTKAGSYMTEQAAIAAGDRPDHGKACH